MGTGTQGFVGLKLSLARRARGMTAKALAETVGVSAQAVSQYEKGTHSPQHDVLRRVSSVLNIPTDYFLCALAEREEAPIYWRSRATATKGARDRVEVRLEWLKDISDYLSEFFDFPEVNLPVIEVPDDFHEISAYDIELAAKQLREHWGLGVEPLPDLIQEMENNGIFVARTHMGAEKQDALSQCPSDYDHPFVLLGTDGASAVRQRFDASHELAHLIIHYKVPAKAWRTPADYKLLEEQAHKFASAFLLPEEGFAAELWAPTLDSFLALKERWGASIAAMIMRCEALNISHEGMTRRLFINMSKRGWRNKEPLDNSLKKERPRLFRRSVEMLLSEKVQSVAQICNEIALNPNDIEELCELEPGTLSEGSLDAKATPTFKTKVASNVVKFPG